MAIISTKAIAISSIKYGDSSLIVKLYTREEGLKSYLLKGILKSKKGKLKAAYFQAFTQLMIVASHNDKRSLHSIREAQVSNPYNSIHTHLVKQSIVMFLTEIVSSVIQEEEANEPLFEYLEKSLLWLDSHENIANFHLLFLLNLTKFLGFYPDLSNQNYLGFHLKSGLFTNSREKNVIIGEELSLFKRMLGMRFDTIEKVNFSKNERLYLLRVLIRYFELHLEGFKQPKSLAVLEAVFSR